MIPRLDARSQRLVEALVAARSAPFARLPTPGKGNGPADLREAYAIAQAVTDRLGPVGGWKIGATGRRGQAFLGLAEPFWGAVLRRDILRSPARLPADGAPVEIEPEIVFRLAQPVEAPVEAVSVGAFVSGAWLGLEVNRPSFAAPFEAGGLCIVADKGVNRALVIGPALPGWRDLDLGALALSVEAPAGRMAGDPRGSGFEPLEALAWLANARLAHDAPLQAGHYVATGAVGGALPLSPGESAAARVGALSLTLTVDAA